MLEACPTAGRVVAIKLSSRAQILASGPTPRLIQSADAGASIKVIILRAKHASSFHERKIAVRTTAHLHASPIREIFTQPTDMAIPCPISYLPLGADVQATCAIVHLI